MAMQIAVLRGASDPQVHSVWAPAHRVVEVMVSTCSPLQIDIRGADWVLILPEAATAMRFGPEERLCSVRTQAQVVITRGGVATTTFRGPDAGATVPRGGAFPLSSNSVLKLHHLRVENGTVHPANNLFFPLLGYLKRHATCSVASSAGWLPLLPFTLPLAVRSVVELGGTEIVLPLNPDVWDAADFRLLLEVAFHYRHAGGQGHHPAWADGLRMFRNGYDLGRISENERLHFLDNATDCVTDVFDAFRCTMLRHRYHGAPYHVALSPKERWAVLELFVHPRVPSACVGTKTPYWEAGGKPVQFQSEAARQRQVNSAIQKINGPDLPEIVLRVPSSRPRQLVLEPGDRIVALITSEKFRAGSPVEADLQGAFT